jgi:diguanylate cyclase (GGDEF)-like protein
METIKHQKDELTGLLTRRYFDEQLAAYFEKAAAVQRPFTLAFLDLDKFLRSNEKYGHSAGDELLQSISSLIRSGVPDESIVARYGGDEFAVLFPNLEREQALLHLETLRKKTVEMIFDLASHRGISGITISAGLATYPVDGITQNELVRKADQALYRAKEFGGNSVKLSYEEHMVPKTTHYTQTQLERLTKLAETEGVGGAVLLREALDNLLLKYRVTAIENR